MSRRAYLGMPNVFEVVAEPSRRRILDLLQTAPRAVNDLAEALGLAQPAVSKHLKVLREAGLVETTRGRGGGTVVT